MISQLVTVPSQPGLCKVHAARTVHSHKRPVCSSFAMALQSLFDDMRSLGTEGTYVQSELPNELRV